MTIMGPGDARLRRLEAGADSGSEVCFQELNMRHTYKSGLKKIITMAKTEWLKNSIRFRFSDIWIIAV